MPVIFDVLEHEGFVSAAHQASTSPAQSGCANDLGPGKTIVTILADYGTRYQSKLFNPEFLRAKKLPVPEWLERKSDIKPPFEKS